MNNLNPYGHGENISSTQNSGDWHQYAMDRARDKLAITRRGNPADRKAGFSIGSATGVLILAIVLSFPVVLLGVSLAEDDPSSLWIIVLLLGFVWGGFALYVRSNSPKSPKRALVQFYRSLGSGKYKRARALVIAADRDSTGRVMPSVHNLGHPLSSPVSFDTDTKFDGYWRQLLRDQSMPYCLARVQKVHVNEVAEDVVVVNFQLTLIRNTQLWMLLIVVALIIAVIVDLATRKVTKLHMQKVLIKVGDEWKVFNGEWQGYDELHHDWLRALPNQ